MWASRGDGVWKMFGMHAGLMGVVDADAHHLGVCLRCAQRQWHTTASLCEMQDTCPA